MSPESADTIALYNAHQRLRCLSRHTVYRSLVVLRSFASTLEGPILDASRQDVERWLTNTDTIAKSRYTYISHVASFFHWALREELAERDPTLAIIRPRAPRAVPRPIASDDLRFALEGADARMRAWLCLAAFQGFRCKEIVDLTVDDLRLVDDPPLVIVSKGKGGHGRVMPLHPEALVALRRYGIPRAGHVFCRLKTLEPMAASTVSRYIAEYLRYVGIEATAHQLRHWFASGVYHRTRDLRLTQELMGHASPSTTAVYASYAKEEAVAAVWGLSA